ncbi:MAG: M1 family metallopeptidase, partial [Burkholderiaceae bacterium]|nr:M1 family metallopeptidase [Burkholderiaceae bacterium]
IAAWLALVVLSLPVAPVRAAPAVPERLADAGPVPTGRLPRNVMPRQVGLALRIDPALPRFSGEVQIEVDVAAATRTIWLHGRGLNLTRATITSPGASAQALAVTAADASGVLRLDAAQPVAAGPARIDLAWDAPFGELQGAYRLEAAGEDYVVTQMQPLGARDTFPGFDEPGFKQPWQLRLTIPEGLQGLANTRLVETRPAGPGWKTLVFAATEPLPSYLVAFAVGPWDIVDAAPLPPNAVRSRSLPLRGIAPRGQGARMRYMLGQTAAMVAALEDYFAIAYPYDKLDLLAAPDFGAGAMENAGLLVYRDWMLYADETSETWRRLAAVGTHAHELAHQWFGNLVTMPWWDDIWLNEGFANWMSQKIVDPLQPGRQGERWQLESSLRAMRQDSLASTRRIREPVDAANDIASAFDGVTYSKGAAVLAMFERWIGAERFRDGVRAYIRRHAMGHATSSDLVDALADASPTPAAVRAAFASFIDQPGVPLLTLAVDCAGPAPALRIGQQRYLPVGSGASPAGVWQVPLCVRWGDGQGVHSHCGLVGGRAAVLPLPAASCPAWLMPNAEGAGYYRFALRAADAARLESNFDQLDAREQRVFADSVSAAFDAGALDLAGLLRASSRLAGAAARETATVPLDRLAWLLEHADLDTAQRQALREFVRRSYGPRIAALGTEPRAGDSDDDRLLRETLLAALAHLGRDPALRAALADQGRRVLGLGAAGAAAPGDGRLRPAAVAPDRRGLALRIAMEEGDVQVFDALRAALAATQDAGLRSQLLLAMGGARAPELQARARALALEPDALRRNEIALLLGERQGGSAPWLGGDPVAQQAAREWIDRHFDTLAARVAPFGAALAKILGNGLCSAEQADALQAANAGRMRMLEGGPRSLAQEVERVRLCAALRAFHRGSAVQPPA